jgi:myo-inositol 2-dehydrogenase/D-chiro-inositol 1-dehydrogenase
MSEKINIAVIGTGRMGSVHVGNLVNRIPEANLAALCDVKFDVVQAVAKQWEIKQAVQHYQDLLEDKTIEAVLIATSTDTHTKILKDCAIAGKHIFCEKPLALDLNEIDEVLSVVEQAGVKLQVGFNRRFDKNFRQVRQIVKSGELGRPCLLKITNRDPALPSLEFLRSSGGLFLDMTIHDFDMARFQIGEVDEVYATGSVLIDEALKEFGDLDTAVISLKFKDGTLGSIDNSRQAVYGYDQRVEVFCLNGTAMAENETEHTVAKGNLEGFHTARVEAFFMQRYGPCYIEEVREFLRCVRDDQPVPVSGEDGRQAVVLGYAAWKSFHENRPVKVSEIAG